MGIISFSIPSDLVFTFSKKYDIKNFVETGTFKGNSSVWASNHFKNVYTIEIDETIYNETKNRSDAGNNIEFILGNSKDEIPKVIEKLDGPAIFWLDGHWCVGAGGKEMECPINDELIAISKRQDCVILIDDARCFLSKLPPPHNSEDWPRIDEIFALIKKYYPDYIVTIAQDVIVAVPSYMKKELDFYMENNFYNFYGETNIINKYSIYKLLKIKLRSLFN